jgi:PST family polysaccharide transporter
LAKILSYLSWLTAEELLRMGVGLLVAFWIARYLSLEQFGLINYANAFVSLFAVLATLGLNSIVVRDLVTEKSCHSSASP